MPNPNDLRVLGDSTPGETRTEQAEAQQCQGGRFRYKYGRTPAPRAARFCRRAALKYDRIIARSSGLKADREWSEEFDTRRGNRALEIESDREQVGF